MRSDANLEARFHPDRKPGDTETRMLTDPLSTYDTIYALAAGEGARPRCSAPARRSRGRPSCAATFVKLRLRDGEPLDAKVYLQAGSLPWEDRGARTGAGDVEA